MKIKDNMEINQLLDLIEKDRGENAAFVDVREDFSYFDKVWPMDVGYRFVSAFGIFGYYKDIEQALYASLIQAGVPEEYLDDLFVY